MGRPMQSRLLNALLDKYEKSQAFRESKVPRRRILLNLFNEGKTDFPDYDIEKSEQRSAVNQDVRELADQGLLGFEWMKGETGHIIARVWLDLEHLCEAYAFVCRTPRRETLDDLYLELLEAKDFAKTPWIRAFFEDSSRFIEEKQSLPALLPGDQTVQKHLFETLRALDDLGEAEVTERVFSMKTFGDSKLFEKSVRSRLVSILRKYLEADDDAKEADLLKEAGLVKYPEQFEFCGPLQLQKTNGSIDFSLLCGNASLSLTDLEEGEIELGERLERVITIENRANYFDYIRKNKQEGELVIYHGGQYSPSRKQFFLKVRDAMEEDALWLHWGDLDYGGFTMLARLRREISPFVRPFRMDLSELLRFRHLAALAGADYGEKLKRLLDQEELKDMQECIHYMAENGLRLEQESMLTEA